MTKRKDIQTLEDIQLLVNTFYSQVREDELLKNIFDSVIGNHWPQHLEKMYSFWQTILLEQYTYKGTPFPPHLQLPIEQAHFERWQQLFNAAVDELFTGEKAERAKWQASRMAEMFLSKINYYRNLNPKPVL